MLTAVLTALLLTAPVDKCHQWSEQTLAQCMNSYQDLWGRSCQNTRDKCVARKEEVYRRNCRPKADEQYRKCKKGKGR